MEIELKQVWNRAISVFVLCASVVTMVCSIGNAQEIPDDPTSSIAAEVGDQETNKELLAAINSLDETLEGPATPDKIWLRERLQGLGVIGGGVLAILGVLFAYLRLDHATRGFYGGRLQLIAAIAASAILAICYYLWTQVLFS